MDHGSFEGLQISEDEVKSGTGHKQDYGDEGVVSKISSYARKL